MVETAVVVAIVAILAVIGLPPLQELMSQHRADATMSALRADVALARTSAIMSGRGVTVCPRTDIDSCAPTPAWQQGWLVRPTRAPDDDVTANLRTGTLPGGVTLHSNRKALRYRSDGTSAGSNQTIRICVDGRQRATLVINNGGRPRSQRTVPHLPC